MPFNVSPSSAYASIPTQPEAIESGARPKQSDTIKSKPSGSSEGALATQTRNPRLLGRMQAAVSAPSRQQAVAARSIVYAPNAPMARSIVDAPSVPMDPSAIRKACRRALLEGIEVRYVNDSMAPDVNGNHLQILAALDCSSFLRRNPQIPPDKLDESRRGFRAFFERLRGSDPKRRVSFADSTPIPAAAGNPAELLDVMGIVIRGSTREGREKEIEALLCEVETYSWPTPDTFMLAKLFSELRHLIMLKTINVVDSRADAQSTTFKEAQAHRRAVLRSLDFSLEALPETRQSLDALLTRYLDHAQLKRKSAALWLDRGWQPVVDSSVTPPALR
jgi:hypothetical protein